MKSITLYFLRPLEIAAGIGVLLFIANLVLGKGLFTALAGAVLPALITLALFTTGFLLILFITWISSSTTEV
jgi:hypothetical protein